MEKYIIEFTEDEINIVNNIFKVASKNINKQLAKNQNRKVDNKKNKELNLFFSVINKFYNAKKREEV